MKTNYLLAAAAIAVAGILALGLLATAAQQSPTAIADNAEILTIDTVPLQGLSLDSGEFLLLADTTPAEIESGHVALSIPCEENNGDTPTSDVALVAGIAPDVEAVDLEYVGDLSTPDDNRCTFHVTIPENDEDITDVAIINTANETVEFESGHFATISLTTAKGDDDEEDADGDGDNGETRTFTADLTGDQEVPEVDTDASGDAEVTFEEGGDEIDYEVNVMNIVDVTAAHIHMGEEDEEGDIVATLYDNGDNGGEIDGELASGTITSSDLEGPLDGEDIQELMDLIEDGEAYVNVHTEEYPDGEIRGQLEE